MSKILYISPNRRKFLAIAGMILVLAAIVVWQPSLSSAQESGSALSVSPPTAFIKVKPGSTGTHTITLENLSSAPVALRPVFYDFTSDGKTGLPALSPHFSFAFLDIPPGGFPQVQIPARSKAQLTLMFNPPATAQDGEYPFTVVFESTPSPTTTGQTAISPGIGSNVVVLVTSQDTLPSQLKVDQVKTARLVDSFAPLKLEVWLKNNGLSAQVASGSAVLKNWRGEEVASYTLYPDIVLGKSTRLARSLEENSNPNNEDNQYSASDIQLPAGFHLGLYTWQVKLQSNTNDVQIYNLKLIALPWVVMLLTAVGGGLIMYWFYLKKVKSR